MPKTKISSSEKTKLPTKLPNGGLGHKAKVYTMIAGASIATLFSSCTHKTVDEQVREIIKEKQEQVDDLMQEKRELLQELAEKDLEINQAKAELRKAQRLQH